MMIKKIIRITLWTIVALLLAFIIYLTGAVVAMTQIEEKCELYHGFSTTEDKAFVCIPIQQSDSTKKGVDS